ncbi:peptide chain release factor N(5)-glutamine methyltransferase [Bifidobacterium tibiigranuli]|jgi:release factor glutamine methyltransferase|uniref:peptide chain release factor N(5)-glutamine methyltransferase n=1 Tax=Bifidobacterium tibiigranuli TaxID=2172043 RepID=UPI0026EE5DE3|nr:peptide chain release factor N(5)-glutamine methyltransferase [Bifidobacterium tibiigranuli]MCI1649496.1 peptide chain release factor N(5)-glutamine methyltransferase [Bifidobacterium tibiigranuli]MCI2185044.1 peptide chain release factor N(5)-glutamine methyltransferase [Bifidobacterium tibiigranuli]MCI2203391.1 peptide chain release factor N(5)-glutamine methyltransferase [Bifidobacterium tibiigranuli]
MPAGQSGDASHDSQALSSQLRAAAETLRAAGVDTPQVDAKLLMACTYGVELHDIDKAMLLGRELSEDAQAAGRFKTMLARRLAREPLQYITGHAPFRFLDLAVGPGVFIPRPETESVVQAALDWLGGQRIAQPRVVDLCAGSGAIGLSVATELPKSQVWAVERSPQALAWTRRNRDTVLSDAVLGAANESARYHLIQGDATDAETLAELDGTIDTVVTNPPYVPLSQIPEQPEVREHDPDMALYGGSDDGLTIPIAILIRSAALLRHGGLLVMEHDISQGQPLVECALRNGFETARTGNDLTGRPRYLFAIRG